VPFIDVGGRRLEYVWHGPGPGEAPTLVFLHEGLGSVSLWRDFPKTLAERTGLGALVYSRLGHGHSGPLQGPRTASFMHEEAQVVLPSLLDAMSVVRPLFVGHSDGGSIALIYAGSNLGPVAGLLLEAPHVFVEDLTVSSIARLGELYDSSDFATRLQRHHGANTELTFREWCDVWLAPEFRGWNIEEYLPNISASIFVVQGLDDEYGTTRQVTTIAQKSAGSVATLLLPDCRHSPHIDRSNEVLDAMATFIDDLCRHEINA
jgi:pimeloyl-ACP methyl ester carboxylesterase